MYKCGGYFHEYILNEAVKRSVVKPKVMFKCTDELTIIHKDNYIEFLNILNSIVFKLKFIVEIEESKKLYFLDFTITSIEGDLLNNWFSTIFK